MRTIEIVCPICGKAVDTLSVPGRLGYGRIIDPFSVCDKCQRERPYDIVVINEEDYEFFVAHRNTVESEGGRIERGYCVVKRECYERIRGSTYQ